MSTLISGGAIELAAKDLDWIIGCIAKIGPKGTLSKDSKDFFALSSQLRIDLENAKQLIPVREVALQSLFRFPIQKSHLTPDLFIYNGLEVPFKMGRFLLFQNYTITTWALYDSLSKVIGILYLRMMSFRRIRRGQRNCTKIFLERIL